MGILVILGSGFFIWRHRRQKKRHLAQQQSFVGTGDNSHTEKAQLHSDEYRPHREELQGSKVPPRIRTVGGMNELDATGLERVRSEMASNEPAAQEISSDMSPITDSSTLVGSRSGR